MWRCCGRSPDAWAFCQSSSGTFTSHSLMASQVDHCFQRMLPKLQPRNSTFPRTWSGEAQPTAILVKTRRAKWGFKNPWSHRKPHRIKDIFLRELSVCHCRFTQHSPTKIQPTPLPTSPHSLVGRQRPRPPENWFLLGFLPGIKGNALPWCLSRTPARMRPSETWPAASWNQRTH